VTRVSVLARVMAVAAGLAVLAAGAAAAPGKTRVLWLGSKVYVTADGSAWRDVTPSDIVPPASIDNVAFPGNREGWLVASACGSGRGAVYRTGDAGRHWTRYRFQSHYCGAGSNFLLSALDARRAWVVRNEPTASYASLFATTNGGRSWRKVQASLPDNGAVTFVDGRRGWLTSGRLYRTLDGGKTWHRQALPAPNGFKGKLFALSRMSFFGRQGVVVGEHYFRKRDVLGVYRTSDTGSHWHLVTTLPGAGAYVFPQFTLSALSASTIWLFTSGVKPFANVTTDGGRHWSRHRLAQRLFAPVALSARVAAASDFHGVPYITRDGGRTWRPLRL
jgi:photosystem II stability/assembly factor-like uncharacterized protein